MKQFTKETMFCDFKFNFMWDKLWWGAFMVVILYILSNFITFDLVKENIKVTMDNLAMSTVHLSYLTRYTYEMALMIDM